MHPLQINSPPLVVSASARFAPSFLFIKSLWQKISAIASRFFATLSHFCAARSFFSAKEITLLRDDRPNTRQPPAYLGHLKDKSFSIQTPIIESALLQDSKINQEPLYLTFDDSLENLRAFLREFSLLGVDAIYEKHIVEHLESAQTLAPSLPPIIKSIAKLLVEMGDKAAKPLFKKFAQQKAQTIDPALQKIFNLLLKPDLNDVRDKLSIYLHEELANAPIRKGLTSADYVDPLLKWFLKPEGQNQSLVDLFSGTKDFDEKIIGYLFEKATLFWTNQLTIEKEMLYSTLESKLCTEFKEIKTIKAGYIKPILNWLLLSDHSTPLAAIFGELSAKKEELIDKIFERSVSLLVEKKIDHYSHVLEKTMQRHLAEIIHQMMQKNVTRIADFFSERLSELISSMPFTETIDGLIHDILYLQVQGIIQSDNELERQKEFLDKKAPAIARLAPLNVEAVEAQIHAQNHLNSVEQHGGKEAFLQHMFLEKFTAHPTCTAHMQQVINQEIKLILKGKDPHSVRRASEKALCSNAAENLLNLMMPIRKKVGAHGEVEEVDPFAELWDRFYLPEEFRELSKYFEELTQEFVTPETTALLEKIKQPAQEIIKNLFKSTAKDLLKKQLGDVVQKVFEKITIPEKINEINAETTLPAVNSILITTFSKQVLGRHLKEFTPLFHKLITCDSAERAQQIRLIQQTLIKLTKSKFQHFNPAEFYSIESEKEGLPTMELRQLTSIDWLALTYPIVTDLEEEILHSHVNKALFNPETATAIEIADILKKVFNAKSISNHPGFGKLSMDLLFRLGKLQNESFTEFFIETFIKNSLSSLMTEAIEPWRESYHKLVDTTSAGLKKSFANPQSVKSLFSEELKASAITDQKLAHQLNVTACLAHDIIIGLAQEKGTLAKFATKKLIANNPSHINRVITTIYKSLFENQLINQNLAIRVYEKVLQSFSISAENIRNRENIQAHQLAAEYQG